MIKADKRSVIYQAEAHTNLSKYLPAKRNKLVEVSGNEHRCGYVALVKIGFHKYILSWQQ